MISDTIYNINVDFSNYENLIQPDADLNKYIKMAEGYIAKYANNVYNGLAKEMLSSDDAISEIAYCIMIGEMKWKEGGGMKLSSWRIEQAKLGMQKYVNRKNRKHNMQTYNTVEPVLATSGQPPVYVSDYDNKEHASITVNKIIQGSGLTNSEEKAARLRSEGYTFKEIGNELACSDENARLLYNKAISKMGTYARTEQISWG